MCLGCCLINGRFGNSVRKFVRKLDIPTALYFFC